MRRDRLTFAMMFGIPILQLILFGYAINSDPKHLPTAIRVADQSPFARSLVAALREQRLLPHRARGRERGREPTELLATGEVQFVLHIPTDFGREVMRGERPSVLLEADATDPVGDRHRALRDRSDQSPGAGPRSDRAARRSRRRAAAVRAASSSAATTRKASPTTTSSPACSASC